MKRAGYLTLGILCIVASPWLLRGLAPALAYGLPVAVNLALAGLFAMTLRQGHEPMIARFARAERGTLEPDLAVYARLLTHVWVAYFVAAAALAAVLAASGSTRAWLWFTSLGNYAAVAVLFVGEWLYRRHRFAHYRHASPRVLWSHVSAVLRESRRR